MSLRGTQVEATASQSSVPVIFTTKKVISHGVDRMNEKEILRVEKYRSEIYWALSRCYSPPEKSIDAVLKRLEAGLCATGSNAISQAVMMRSELKTAVTFQDIEVQFAKLFIGPYHLLAPPFGSIYLDNKREVMGDSTLDVARRYLAAGFTADEDFTNPPDHISAELEFMHVLITAELNCLHNWCADEAADCLVQQYEFLNSHLGRWIVAFTDLTIKATHLPYFKYLAAITRQFIREDTQRLDETVAGWRVRPERILK